MGNDSKNPTEAGVIPRLCKELFLEVEKLVREKHHQSTIEVSFYEIYNEKVFDLLSGGSDIACRVREHPDKGAYVEGLSRVAIRMYDDVSSVLLQGHKHRAIASTLMNAASSRSHAVFTVHLSQVMPVSESLDDLTGQAFDPSAVVQRVSKV